MSVGKIALGVFIGNLAAALVGLFVFSIVMENQRSAAAVESATASAQMMSERLEAERHNNAQPN